MIKKAFTLAEVLIVIGIIGVVAALTLPNLNHATGDKEVVTRLQKAYSVLSEANDRAVATYGPISTWCPSSDGDDDYLLCYMNRIGEFLKISKSCNEIGGSDAETYSSCNALSGNAAFEYDGIIYQLPDGIIFSLGASGRDFSSCSSTDKFIKDLCIDALNVDVNGATKGKNNWQDDQFRFWVSDSMGIVPGYECFSPDEVDEYCIRDKVGYLCTNWVLEHGNRDYLKADSSGKCNDSNIILDGVTNTSCH